MMSRLKADLGLQELVAALKTNGGDLNAFESAFATLAGQKFALAFPYGRTALIAILQALDLRDREVICPSYTCVVVPHAIMYSHNVPVFVDCSEADMNMDLGLVSDATSNLTGAVVATSLFGEPVDLEALGRLGDIPVIQDCAHSFFAEFKGRKVSREGVCAYYGLNISKMMTSVFGGMVTTDDSVFFERLKQQRDQLLTRASWLKSFQRLAYLAAVYPAFSRSGYKLVNKLERAGALARFSDYYDEVSIDMPDDYQVQMTDLEARVGIVQCQKYSKIVDHRRMISAIYHGRLEGISSLKLPPMTAGATFSHFVIRSPLAPALRQLSLRDGYQLGEIIEYDIPSLASYSKCRKIGPGYSQSLPGKVINLPVHMGVTATDAEKLSRLLRAYVSRIESATS